ncbi:MAG: 1-aminocyclopropane-1-carboxylate deaminase/D-cysteine desulfhydrase [Flavobacteriaceae bacterium]
MNSRIQKIDHPELTKREIQLYIKREDELHPVISGNKMRKLKYNLKAAKAQNKKTLLTFGGAFSNHLLATAAAAKEHKFKAVGVVRGDELAYQNLNPTLAKAVEYGMQLHFVSRDYYKNLTQQNAELPAQLNGSDVYVIPEGGANELAVQGCQEILTESDSDFNFIFCAAGTGTTMAGIAKSIKAPQKLIGVASLRDAGLKRRIADLSEQSEFELLDEYHLGGYAKINSDYIHFLNDFYRQTKVLLDPIYTGKMMYAIFDKVNFGNFDKESQILAIHTGGLQGIQGMNQRLHRLKMPQLLCE